MNAPTSFRPGPDLVDQFDRNRCRMNGLYATLTDEAYYSRPIPLRNPLVFYEGHVPAFSYAHVVRKALGGPPIDARLEALFERGIDPHESTGNARARGNEADQWPSRDEVVAFRDEADRCVRSAIVKSLDAPATLLEAVHRVLEHETMHHETLMYLWHRLPYAAKRRPQGYAPIIGGEAPVQSLQDIPAGRAVLGVARGERPFAWDNEMPAHSIQVPAFRIQRHNVTNAEYLEFVEADAYLDERWWQPEDLRWLRDRDQRHPAFWCREGGRWRWLGMFEAIDLPPSWPVWVTHAEACAYARWRGMRLPTEAEYQRAALGAPDGVDRNFPWGNAEPSSRHGAFGFVGFDPEPAGSHPDGVSAWGVHDLVGNGWEWTSTPFAPFPGFSPMPDYPEYSADFFDGEHFVMKGASPATVFELARPSFRNWFRTRYPYVFASFRCVSEVST
jgi:iron(II)-dependent oxidoreductase